jgi:hypothetical protein
MPRATLLLTSMLLLLNACCPLTSVHPLGDPQKSDYDARLEGVWRQEFEKDYVMLHIGKAQNGRIQVIAVEHDADGKVDYDGFTVSGVRLNNHYYLDIDIAELTPKHQESQKGHVIISYSLPDDNTLAIVMLDLDPVAAAIQAKKLTGEITYQKDSKPSKKSTSAPQSPKIECAYITDTSDNLKRFISASNPGQLFKTVMTFKRVSP